MAENEWDPIKESEKSHVMNFDEDFWIHKATILKKLVEDSQLRKDILGEDKNPQFLLYEIFSTKLHCCETLLRLLIIAKKGYFYPLLPLIKLNFPKFHSAFDLMKKNPREYFDIGFYKKNFYPFKELPSENVEKSTVFLGNTMKYIIKEYDDHMANNVFKHGFYGNTTKDVYISIENQVMGRSPNMIEWYEIHPFENHHKLHHRSKPISVQREFNVIKICSSILKQFFKIKRATINKDKTVSIGFFYDVPLGKIFSDYQEGVTLGQLNFAYEIQLPTPFP